MTIEIVFYTVVAVGVLLMARMLVLDQRLKALVLMNAKIDVLLRHSGISLNPHENLPDDLRQDLLEAIRQGRKLDAVKRYKGATNTELRESKEFIDILEKHVKSDP
jgi:ribosomal protein L7/L12